jgi:hypothetical protein
LNRDGVFVILKSPFFQKILYNPNTKILMHLQRIHTQKKKSIGLQAEKFNMAPKTKMAANLEFLLNSTSTAWFMLEFMVLVLYFMRFHLLKQEKRKKLFKIQNGAIIQDGILNLFSI